MANEIAKNLSEEDETLKEKEIPDDTKNKEKSKSKDIPGLNSDIISRMMMTGDNESGMFAPDEKQLEEELENGEELHEEQDGETKVGKIKSTETQNEYKKAMIEDMGKHPDKYSIETPRGRMSVAEAIQQGFNPETRQFEKSLDEKNEEALSRLNEEDRTSVEQFIDPSQVGLAPADADAFGLSDTSPIRRPNTLPMQQPINQGAAIPVVQSEVPAQAIPTAPQPQAAQGANILSMLGGGQL